MNKIAPIALLFSLLLQVGGCTETQSPIARNDILVEPEPGEYLTGYWNESTPIMLTDVSVTLRPCDRDYKTHFMYPGVDLKAGDPCLVVAGHVENHADERLEIGMFAYGYDANGVWVSETLDKGGVQGSIMFDIEPGQTREFLLHMNPSDKVRSIRVSGGGTDRLRGPTTPIPDEPNPPSSPPVPESEMTRISFSRSWLLDNDHDPSERYVEITFPESWLRDPPDIPEGEGAVELAVPTAWLIEHNTSDNLDEIAVRLPDHYFDGF